MGMDRGILVGVGKSAKEGTSGPYAILGSHCGHRMCALGERLSVTDLAQVGSPYKIDMTGFVR